MASYLASCSSYRSQNLLWYDTGVESAPIVGPGSGTETLASRSFLMSINTYTCCSIVSSLIDTSWSFCYSLISNCKKKYFLFCTDCSSCTAKCIAFAETGTDPFTEDAAGPDQETSLGTETGTGTSALWL